mgnify:CR=1 FL=1
MRLHSARITALGMVLLLGSASVIAAQREMLGATPEEIIDRLGPPESVYSADSPAADVRAVVFFYDDYRYFYFYDNRVWQVRLDERSDHEVEGFVPERTTDADADADDRQRFVAPGDNRRALFNAFGSPVLDDGESLVFDLEDRGYPVRLRAFVDEQYRIVDMYLYRADF